MIIFFVFLSVLLLPVSLRAQVSQALPAESAAGTQTVAMLFSATDRGGSPIRVSKEQVTVTDNLQAADVVEVSSAEELPLHLGIVLLSSKSNFNKEQGAALELVQKVIRPGIDQAFVVTAGGRKPWPGQQLEWRSDPAQLAAEIKALDKEAGLPDAFEFDINELAAGISRGGGIQQWRGGGFSVFDVIWQMMQSDLRPARRVVVMFRNPWAHSAGFSQQIGEAVSAEHDRKIAAAQQLGISFQVIGVEERKIAFNPISTSYNTTFSGQSGETRVYDEEYRKAMDAAYAGGRSNVTRLAEETGGRIWWSSKKNYPDAVAGIVSQLAGQYVVRFRPTNRTPGAHSLKLDIGRDGQVSIAKAYFMPEGAR